MKPPKGTSLCGKKSYTTKIVKISATCAHDK